MLIANSRKSGAPGLHFLLLSNAFSFEFFGHTLKHLSQDPERSAIADMEDAKEDDKPPPTPKAFQGQGHKLGGATSSGDAQKMDGMD